MSNLDRYLESERKKELKAQHKASNAKRNLRKNRHDVWIGKKEEV